MFITKKSLARRTFLRGAGTLLALPLLDAMIPASTALAATPAKPVRRFGAAYVPHGVIMNQWTPVGSGTGFEFSPILKSLEPFRNHIVVVSGLVGAPSHADGGHAIAPSIFLSFLGFAGAYHAVPLAGAKLVGYALPLYRNRHRGLQCDGRRLRNRL